MDPKNVYIILKNDHKWSFFNDPKNVYIILKNDHKWSFFNIIYTFLFGYNTVV